MAKYNIDMRLDQLLANELAAKAVEEVIPGLADRAKGQESILGLSPRKIVEYSRGVYPESLLELLAQKLDAVPPEDDRVKGDMFKKLPPTPQAEEVVWESVHTAIYPGKVWRDTKGRRIQAHAGGLLYEDGIYYWYGENKEKTDGKSTIWTYGIRVYSSGDLYNWKDEGCIIPPDLEDSESDLWPEKYVDRPHILKCERTGKYVCWLKLSGNQSYFTVLQADTLMGPYTIVAQKYQPFGIQVGDFDLIRDEEGRGYLFVEANHDRVLGMELSQDYLQAARQVSSQYAGLYPPFCREGVAVFERKGIKYMFTSGMSGYIPNESECAWSSSWEEAFTGMGNPHVEDETMSSFNSQISQVFKVPGKKDLYIALADRWVPEYPMDAERVDIFRRAIASRYEPEKYQVTEEERRIWQQSPATEKTDTSMSDYVWLPLRFTEPDEEHPAGRVQIDWLDQWKIEDYE
ncbi:MAG: family 43 glycosylhydrolase [Acetatifactor sp.]|nr:family 43 glycosylhydrolase [Acetatifactor sp.]